MMSRPAPIDTQSPNVAKRIGKKVVGFLLSPLTPKKSSFSPISSEKSQKPLPPFEPQRPLPSVVIHPDQSEPPLRHVPSQKSLRPTDARSHHRSGSRESRREHGRSASRSSLAPRKQHDRSRSRDSTASRRSTAGRSLRSFDSRWTRDEPYRDPDDRDFRLKPDAGAKEIDGIRYWWTNLYLGNDYLGRFYCRQEPRLSTKSFFPGMMIWATHSVFQNDKRATPGDPHITLAKDAPVYTKPRPMVVLYATHSGLCCAPMFSLSGSTRKRDWDNTRELEYVSLAEEGDDWAGDTPWFGVIKFRPDPGRRRYLKSRCFISLAQTMYVSTQEYLETDLGYLPGDMYNRLIIALDFYQEKRKRIAFGCFRESYENRGTKLTDEGIVSVKERAKVSVQNIRMCQLRPTRDNYEMTWTLDGEEKVQELIGHEFKDAEYGRLQSHPVPGPEAMSDY